MNTSTHYKSIRSPFQAVRKQSYNVQDKRHPVRLEIQKFIGAYQIDIQFEEDQETLQKFRHIPGLIAILCTLRKDGKVVGLGRSISVVNRINRIVERTVSMAINGIFLSACNSATKVLDTLRLEAPALTGPRGLGEAYKMPEEEVSEFAATDRQKSYLRELLSLAIEDEREREVKISQIDEMTKSEASAAIKILANAQ